MRHSMFILALSLVCIYALQASGEAQTIDQKLLLVQNDQVASGSFVVAVQVKGTSLPAANTLGSATIDVTFDSTKLSFVNASAWAFGSAQGYSRSATSNTTPGTKFIRVGVLGSTVNADGGGSPPGFDIGSSYATWVQLNFTISSATGATDLTIIGSSNQIGLFENHANDPATGIIINYCPSGCDGTLSAPTTISGAPLPIQLASFAATVIRGNDVEVAWKTVSETNNYGFEIYRKRGEIGDWKKSAFVEGHGTTLTPQSYAYLDSSVSFGKYFYRIKQIDLDGKSKDYPEMQVSVGVVPDKMILTQNYPNPFNPSTLIDFVVAKSGPASVKVYNLLGQEVATLFDGNADAGNIYTAHLNASRLASGIYFYTLRSAGNVDTKRMLLLK